MVKNILKSMAFNATSTGASHIKENKPCQDFSMCWTSGGTLFGLGGNSGKIAIAAVADGHGADLHFRSDRGSRFAAEAAVQCIKEFVLQNKNTLNNPAVLLSALEKSIIAAWYEKIADDIRGDAINTDAFIPYGTTLLAAALTENYWFAIQIGDGKCVVFNTEGRISQPVPWDEKCFLCQTTSLCDENAGNLFRHFYGETLPLAVFLGSDGIDDSFPVKDNEEHLARFYREVYNNFVKEGLKKGSSQLREMLPLLTQKGSGDDVSIAGIIRNIKP